MYRCYWRGGARWRSGTLEIYLGFAGAAGIEEFVGGAGLELVLWRCGDVDALDGEEGGEAAATYVFGECEGGKHGEKKEKEGDHVGDGL